MFKTLSNTQKCKSLTTSCYPHHDNVKYKLESAISLYPRHLNHLTINDIVLHHCHLAYCKWSQAKYGKVYGL